MQAWPCSTSWQEEAEYGSCDSGGRFVYGSAQLRAGAGLTGGVCWLVYLLVKAGSGSMILGAFLASLSVALMGHLFARIFRAPVSVFLVPGILPLVPGTSIYNSVYYVIRNSREESMYYLVETLQIAGAIALAVFLMDSVFKLIGKKKRIKV